MKLSDALQLVVDMAGDDRETWFGKTDVSKEMQAMEMVQRFIKNCKAIEECASK